MTRKTIDCRTAPNDVGCTLAISGEPDELVTAAARHAVDVHGHSDTPELREELRGLLAEAYPKAAILGSDYHQASVDTARKRAADAGLADRARFEVASAQTFSGTGYDLVATFDCLHDMGDPVGAARHIRQALDADGTWLIVEPVAGDTLAENLNPVSRVYYSFSTFICVPAARSQPGGYSLGSQAGEEAIREVAAQAGFGRFRRAEQTPFNAVYEARP